MGTPSFLPMQELVRSVFGGADWENPRTLQVPEGDVDARQRAHEDRTPSVEASPPRQLPYVLDIIGLEASDTVEPGVQAALDGLRMALQRGLAPANIALVVHDLDEEPAWRHPEVLHGSYFPHFRMNYTDDLVDEAGEMRRRLETVGKMALGMMLNGMCRRGRDHLSVTLHLV